MTEVIRAAVGGLRGPGLTEFDQSKLDAATSAAAEAQTSVDGIKATLTNFGVSDPLNSTQGRTLTRADGAAISSNYTTAATGTGIAIDYNTGGTGSTNTTVLMPTASVVLSMGQRSRIVQKLKGTRLGGGAVRGGLSFGSAGSRIHANLRGDGYIYLTNDALQTVGQNLATARSQAVFGVGTVPEAIYEWDGAGNILLTLTTPNGVSGPYTLTNIPAGPVWYNFTTNGTIEYVAPLKVEKLPALTQALYDQQAAEALTSRNRADLAIGAAQLNGISLDLADPELQVYTVPKGGSVTTVAAAYDATAGGLVIDSTSNASHLINFALPRVVAKAGAFTRVEPSWQKLADTASGAFYHGVAFGAPGSRRHYIMNDGGSLIVYDDTEATVSGSSTVVYAAASSARAWEVGTPVRMLFDNYGDGTGYGKWYVNGACVLTVRFTGVPTGQAYLASRAVAVKTVVSGIAIAGVSPVAREAMQLIRPDTARRISTTPLPDSALSPNPTGGFSTTGGDQIPANEQWAGCWLRGNHGQSTLGAPYAPSVLLLTPDNRKIIWERAMPAGFQSVQGVARGKVPNTFWVVDKRPKAPSQSSIRNFNFDGTENVDLAIPITSIMASPDFALNGIALHPGVGADGSLWVGAEGQARCYLVDIATKSVVRTITGGFAAGADQLGYDVARDWLYFSYGTDIADGSVRFLLGADGGYIGDVLLPGTQAIEMVKLAANGNMVSGCDGGFHDDAMPPLSVTHEHQISVIG